LTILSGTSPSLPAGKNELITFDEDIPGFGIRVRRAGSRTLCNLCCEAIDKFAGAFGSELGKLAQGDTATAVAYPVLVDPKNTRPAFVA